MKYLHPWVQQVCRCIPQHLHEAKMNLDLAPLRLNDVGGKPLQDPVYGESLP